MRLCIRTATIAMCVAVSLLSSCGRFAWAQSAGQCRRAFTLDELAAEYSFFIACCPAAPSCSLLGLPATAPTNGASYAKCQSFGGANWCQSSAAPGWDVCPVINGQASPAPDPVLLATAAKGVCHMVHGPRLAEQPRTVVLPSAIPSLSSYLDLQVVISEVQAVNSGTITNSLGNSPSWVELSNPTSSAVNLQVCAIAYF